ncbi:MAG TPA: hypothetical protein VLD58_13245, partial [Gemmatimonadales bacterium]|nr:hypothetical protein [Gemmatimonadales bacterium]
EQAMGERALDARTDVYALGAMTYEMLVGDPPFTGSTAQAIVAKVLTEEPAGIVQRRRTVPPAVEAAVLTALQKLPADRWASAKEFADALDGTGTPHYMSPEQAMGDRELTPRSDVYALGAMTYEMLLGEPPFTGPTAQSIVAKVMTEKPAPPSARRDRIAPAVEDVVLTALEKLPADRFATAAEFGAALLGTGTEARPARTTATAARAGRPSIRSTALYAALGLAVLLAAWGWLRPTPATVTSRQRVMLWRRSFGSVLSPGVSRIATQAAIAPDGSSIVFSDPTSENALLMHKARNEAEARPISGTEGGVSPFFSPDGRWIGFIAGTRLRKAPVEGGPPITIASDVNPIYPTAAWLDDGTIVYVSINSEFRRVSSDGGAGTPVGKKDEHATDNSGLVAPLPGSRGVLFTSCPGNCSVSSSVFVFDFAADSARLLVPDAAGAWYAPTGHLLYTDRGGSLFAARFDPKSLKLGSGAIPVIEDVLPGSFTMSASGSALYAVATGGALTSELVWVSRDGRAVPVDSSWRKDFQYPALSPDGKSVAVSVRDETIQIWIRRADGTRQKLTDSGSVNWRPAWTSDGRSIVFLSNRSGAGQGGYDAYQVPVDGSAAPALLEDWAYGLWEAERSSDGQWLVFRADEAGNIGRIRGRRLSGDTTVVPLVVGKALVNNVALSPDGHWLAYMSDATGRREVYVTPFPAATSTHLVSRDGGSEPRWGRSGRELFFKSGNYLMAVPITSSTAFVAGTPVPLFSVAGFRSARNRQQYDVAPDGQHFIMIREPENDRPENLVYAENWLAELEAKVKARR